MQTFILTDDDSEEANTLNIFKANASELSEKIEQSFAGYSKQIQIYNKLINRIPISWFALLFNVSEEKDF